MKHNMNKRRFFEFFAGGGMARAGLESQWECAFANDFSLMKAQAYCANWGSEDFRLEDINSLTALDLPGYADLAWASFPCQDLSLAGAAAGLGTRSRQTRSGTFWAFWNLLGALAEQGRAPALVVLENVYGAITTNQGREFRTICTAMIEQGYRIGALVIDASLFVPHSRPRLFFVCVRNDHDVPGHLLSDGPDTQWHPVSLQAAVLALGEAELENWVWLTTAKPSPLQTSLDQIVEDEPDDVVWHSKTETADLVAKMSPVNLSKLARMKSSFAVRHGTIYRRTRSAPAGRSPVRAELRDDGIAGCLRTPGGGSSRQFLLRVQGDSVRSRLLSGREAARLMGLPDCYRLPPRYNDAYHVMGDGVVVPVVRFVNEAFLQPILLANELPLLEAAE